MAQSHTRTRSMAVALLISGLLLALLAPAASAQYETGTSAASFDGELTAGGQVTIEGTTDPGVQVDVVLQMEGQARSEAQVLGTTVSNAVGDYSLTVTIPRDLPTGTHTMAVVADGVVLSSTALPAVNAPTAPPPSVVETQAESESSSGPNTGLLLTGGLAVVAACAVIFVFNRQM